MKKGINLWCFPSDWSLEKKLLIASDAGFDGVELNLEESGALQVSSTEEDLKNILSLINSYKLEIVGVSTSLLWNYPLTSNNQEIRERAIHIVKRMISIAEFFKTDTVLVVPGLVNEETRYDFAYEKSKQAFMELSKYAEQHQVIIAIENVWNKFLLSPLEMKNFLEEIGSPYVKAYFDVGNILSFGFPEQWISILGTYIQRVHVKDYKKDVGTFQGFTTLMQGDVDWPRVSHALHDIQYENYLTAEVMPPHHFPEKHIYDLSLSIETIIKGGLR